MIYPCKATSRCVLFVVVVILLHVDGKKNRGEKFTRMFVGESERVLILIDLVRVRIGRKITQ